MSGSLRKIRMGMVGGGAGAFIGDVHRMAARIDGQIDLVAGAFSRDPENTRQTGLALGLDEHRLYPSYQDMMQAEAALPADIRMDFVAVVTPNDTHVPIAIAALEAGFHVMSDKPAAMSLAEALKLQSIIADSGLLYGLTHTYLGYPMVWQAKCMVADGTLGAIRRIYVEYPQGWFAGDLEGTGNRQASWRTDPARSGISGCMGDIGTHAQSLAEFISGQKITQLCAELNVHVDGRRLDDDGAALFRMDGGATGILSASQVFAGEENALNIRIAGKHGSLEWSQMDPNALVHRTDGEFRTLKAGANHDQLADAALARCRTPGGHPEGYLEAFANLYRDFARAIRDGGQGEAPGVPGIAAGIRGMAFLEAMVASAASTEKWTVLQIAQS